MTSYGGRRAMGRTPTIVVGKRPTVRAAWGEFVSELGFPTPPRSRVRGTTMKKIEVRKPGVVRLTSAAMPLYAGSCAGGALGGGNEFAFIRIA